jgi:NhaP-type Na+/H+ or K+/H+ antiporter
MQLLIIGLVLGLGAKEDMNWWGMATDDESTDSALHKSINGLAKLDAHLMLHIFLPPLIFESAASLEWHLFDKAKTYIACLAGPGILLATFLTAQVLNLMHMDMEMTPLEHCAVESSYSVWPPAAGLLIGVILSATDPVAVVALLKELGVKASLSTR